MSEWEGGIFVRLRRWLLGIHSACPATVTLGIFLVGWGVAGAQTLPTVGLVGGEELPLWMPRPPRFLDRPMTDAEVSYCLKRTDIPKRGPHGHPVSDVPPAPRALLEEPVSVEVSGTIVEALQALMGQTNRLWLAGVRGESADKVAQLTVRDVPLWQALDRLLATYGYDWGYAHGAVVCWPALIPPRERPEVPQAIADVEASADDAAEVLEVPEPTPIDTVLDHFRPARYPSDGGVTHLNRRVAVDGRLRDWKLIGRMTGGDPARGIQQVAAALPAVIDGPPEEGCISMGAHMWLDRAMRGADARAAELKTKGIEIGDSDRYNYPLQDRLRALFTAQQWALMALGGQGVIWFRELPLDVAEIWVLTARVGETRWARLPPPAGESQPGDWSVDWSRPEDFYVMAYYGEELQRDPGDGLNRVVGWHLAVLPSVPMKSGGWRAI